MLVSESGDALNLGKQRKDILAFQQGRCYVLSNCQKQSMVLFQQTWSECTKLSKSLKNTIIRAKRKYS